MTMTTVQFGSLVDELATWWPLSEPWKRAAKRDPETGRPTGAAGLYLEFQPYTLGAALEAVQTYRQSDRSDFCPTPNKLLALTRSAARIRAAEGIDPAEPPPSCSGRHVWALATPSDRSVDHHPVDECAVCHETRPSRRCDHMRQEHVDVCVYCLDPNQPEPDTEAA